jgi:hypothetical protein
MDELGKLGEKTPVKNLRERVSKQYQHFAQGIKNVVVRKLKLKSESVAYDPKLFRVVLYYDTEVIREMRDQVIVTALYDDNIWEKLKKCLLNLASGKFSFEGLAGIDEVVLKPTVKWGFVAEVGADFELKWNLSKDAGIGNAIFMLAAVIPLRSVKDLARQIRAQRSNTPAKELIYPGVAINIWGTIRGKSDVLPEEIVLHEKRYKVRIILLEHNLDQAAGFLKGRPLCVLGLVQSIGKVPSIRAGAILLGSKPPSD